MIFIEINGKDYGFCRSSKCSYDNKHNRMVKIAVMFTELSEKFDRMILKGQYTSETARCALACKMMMYTGIRIGNEDSAEGYVTKPHPNSKKEPEFVKTYGLTTILPEHVTYRHGRLYLNFIGKKQVDNYFTIKGELARQFKSLLDTVPEGEPIFGISVYDLTKFIKRSVGKKFTPKDFRTLRANMCAYEKLEEICKRPLPKTKKEYNAEVKEIAVHVSENLNNTPSVCKASYIDPMLWDEFSQLRPVTK